MPGMVPRGACADCSTHHDHLTPELSMLADSGRPPGSPCVIVMPSRCAILQMDVRPGTMHRLSGSSYDCHCRALWRTALTALAGVLVAHRSPTVSCLRQVRGTPIQQMTLLATSDAHADQHAGLLSRRPVLHAVSLLRWAEWESAQKVPYGSMPLGPLRAPQRERTADAIVDSLTTGLRSLGIGVFALTQGTFNKLDRCAAAVTPSPAYPASAGLLTTQDLACTASDADPVMIVSLMCHLVISDRYLVRADLHH